MGARGSSEHVIDAHTLTAHMYFIKTISHDFIVHFSRGWKFCFISYTRKMCVAICCKLLFLLCRSLLFFSSNWNYSLSMVADARFLNIFAIFFSLIFFSWIPNRILVDAIVIIFPFFLMQPIGKNLTQKTVKLEVCSTFFRQEIYFFSCSFF